MLGAEVQEPTWRPGANQAFVSARVADLIEACSDEWLEGEGPQGEWQDGALLAPFCKYLLVHESAFHCGLISDDGPRD